MFYNDVPWRSGESETAAVNTPALQTLREVQGRPVVAKRLECAWLQHRFRMATSGALPEMQDRKFEEVVKSAEQAAVRVLICRF